MTLDKGAIAFACTPAAEPTDYTRQIRFPRAHRRPVQTQRDRNKTEDGNVGKRAAKNSNGRRRGMRELGKNNQNVLCTCMKLPKTNLINNKTSYSPTGVTSMTVHVHTERSPQ